MKTFFTLLGLSTLFIFTGCGTKYQTVSFEKKRTPLNPIAHNGIVNYNPNVVLSYAENALIEKEEYEAEVEKIKTQYEKAVEKYNNANPAERITQGLTQPQLVLPPQPELPYIYNEKDLSSRIKIEGMERGTQNALDINVFFQGYLPDDIKVEKSTKKRKKNDVEYVDTVFTGRAKVKHEVRVYAQSPMGSEYNEFVRETQQFKELKTGSYTDSITASREIRNKVDSEEKQIAFTNIDHVNNLLNSQFGTKDVHYTAKIFTFKSNKKNDYSDLDEASILAQHGFKILNTDPNSAYEKLNQAYNIWTDALNQHSSDRKARINDKVKKGVLLNLIATSIYTDNWEGALRYITALENIKTKSSETAELNRLRQIYNDLKTRYDALEKG
ncbi:MAG: hypothetical protein WEA99_04100 [Brumimicrobium sp.]